MNGKGNVPFRGGLPSQPDLQLGSVHSLFDSLALPSYRTAKRPAGLTAESFHSLVATNRIRITLPAGYRYCIDLPNEIDMYVTYLHLGMPIFLPH